MADTELSVNASLDDDNDVEEEEAGLNFKKILLILIPILLLAGAGGAYYMGRAAFLKIPDMIVNLSSDDGQPRYLRLSVQLELKNDADKATIEAVMPRVIDQFQTYLRELRVRDLRGSAGIYRLQMELLSRVNAAAYPVEVNDVLFQEILIQ